MDLCHGFHQLALEEESSSIGTFQSHEGLHRFKALFFGPSRASGIFHDKIKVALRGLEGCISIHDNILVYGKTPEEHEENLKACKLIIFNSSLISYSNNVSRVATITLISRNSLDHLQILNTYTVQSDPGEEGKFKKVVENLENSGKNILCSTILYFIYKIDMTDKVLL